MKRQKLDTKEVIKRFKLVHGDTYDYGKVNFIKSNVPVIIICNKHGEFKQRVHAHLKGGCKNCADGVLTIDEIIIEFNKVHNNKYDYNLVKESYKNGNSKIKIICPKHGIFEQKAGKHKIGNGCKKCGIERSTEIQKKDLDYMLKKFKEVHGEKYDYSLIKKYKNMKTGVDIICNKHGVFNQEPHNHIKGNGCPKCSTWGPSKTEERVKNILIDNDIEFIHSDRNVINPHEVDFLLKKNKIAIEVNGLYWHSSQFIDKNYHLDKTLKCLEKDIQLLHFWDYEINNKFDIVSSMILSHCNKLDKIYARKCEIKEIKDNKLVNNFLENNHLQGKCSSSIKLGLYFNDELVSLMTFGKPRFNKKHQWELIRFCNKKYITVIGGASKLFKYFIKNYLDNNSSIISYANYRYSNGNLYEKLNFQKTGISKPSYFYTGKKKFTRYEAQKHKLKSILGKDNFDENKTEMENMENNGYHRVYDCGNLIYVYTKKRQT